MPEYKNHKPCADCGTMTTYRNRKGRCRTCAKRAYGDYVIGMAHKKGPYYEKWKKGMARAARRNDAAKEAGAS